MEFCGREPMDVLGVGDCSNNFYKLTKDRTFAALSKDSSKEQGPLSILGPEYEVQSNDSTGHGLCLNLRVSPSRQLKGLSMGCFQGLRSALRSDGACLQTCRVPISTGSLLVFSNYQAGFGNNVVRFGIPYKSQLSS